MSLEAMLDTLADALHAGATTAQIDELKRLPELERFPEIDYGVSGGSSQPRMALAYLVNDPKQYGHYGNVRDEGYDEDGKSIVRKRCGAPRLPPRLPPLRPRRAVPSHPNSCTAPLGLTA